MILRRGLCSTVMFGHSPVQISNLRVSFASFIVYQLSFFLQSADTFDLGLYCLSTKFGKARNLEKHTIFYKQYNALPMLKWQKIIFMFSPPGHALNILFAFTIQHSKITAMFLSQICVKSLGQSNENPTNHQHAHK